MTTNHNPTLKSGDVADMYHSGTDRFYEATVVKLLADHEARERFRYMARARLSTISRRSLPRRLLSSSVFVRQKNH
jgi:hypothetical protein